VVAITVLVVIGAVTVVKKILWARQMLRTRGPLRRAA
jgi:hypothetical protein